MFNPAEASKKIKDEFIDYIATLYAFSDLDLQDQIKKELKATISKGPIVEIKDIFRMGKSIQELINDNLLSRLFINLESNKPKTKLYKPILPIDRPLYEHQQKAIEKIVNGRNVVVSTGTGSGKTNCFLIPVLNELLREKENGTLNPGVRALFIYPMNALSNDQMRNLREILMYYPDITFGSYNGATEYDEDKAVAVYEAMFGNEKIPELRKSLPNELLSRDEMKKTPPHILFTNYAMLEHMLFRPNDDVLFSNADFKFVVLDEAHVYNGATGIETSILIRRLKARIASSKPTQFILTSATLGNNNSVDDDIVQFANNLCGVNFNKSDIIRATREKYTPIENCINYPINLFVDLANEESIVWNVMQKYNIPVDKNKDEKELLYELIIASRLYNKMRKLMGTTFNLKDFANELNITVEQAICFISLCAKAQKNKKSLIDARYHFFIKSLEGCYLALSPQKQLFLNRKRSCYDNGNKYEVFEVAICEDCGSYALVGQIKDNKLCQGNKIEEPVDFFYPEEQYKDYIEEEENNENKEIYYVCIKCGAIVAKNELHNLPCDCGINEYIKVIKARHLEIGARCGNCNLGRYNRVYLGSDAATAVLATSLYEELPEEEFQEPEKEKVDNIFGKAILAHKKKAKKIGRQFLVFSDSRQEAARFACYMSKSYNEFLRRRGLWRVIKDKRQDILNNEYTISDFVKLLTNYFTSHKSFAKSNFDEGNLTFDSRKNAWVALLNQLYNYRSSTSFTSLGQLQFEYLGNRGLDEIIAQEYNITLTEAKTLLDLLSFEIIKSGAICTDNADDINDDDREYIFYSSNQKFIIKYKSSEDKRSYIANWLPKQYKGKDDSYYTSYKLYITSKILKIDKEKASELLKNYWDYLTHPELGNSYCMVDINKDGTYSMPAKNFIVKINGSKGAFWYQCKKCGRISQFSINGKCSKVNCGGDVVIINPEKIEEINHYAKLYSGERMSPLFIKEHTAQLSKKESADYQQQFIKREINALSCSTTFEMGVDVGELETVFLRNVPPLPSNYAQRAGRAGRRINAAAFALTFAKLSSHDFSFFNNPELMINGVILPPLFKIDNEKIVKRHIYAIALGMYFSKNEMMYDNNNADKFINQKGYFEFIAWLNSQPVELKELLKESIPNEKDLHNRLGIDDFSWISSFWGEEGVFTQLINEYEKNIADFEELINYYKDIDIKKAAKYQWKMEDLKHNRLIDFLARGNVLPKYGFPVDTVELHQNSSARNISKLRLSRDLQIAIAEYAPSSEVIADGRMYTSRYIKKENIGRDRQDWTTAYIGRCDNPDCETINYSRIPIGEKGINCISCGMNINKRNFHESIEPRAGFVAERKDKDVPMKRQEKNYRSEDYYIGNKSSKLMEKYNYSFNGIDVTIESTTNDSLLVKSTTDFYVCRECGYAVAEDESIGEKKITQEMLCKAYSVTTENKHEKLDDQNKCRNKKLHRYSLHHVFNTDVAKITFDCDTSDYDTMYSTMYAILNTFANLLNIERRDIKACLSKRKVSNSKYGYSIIIYDAVPGGAGHSRRLVTKDGRLLYKVLLHAKKSMENCNCDPSCYRCLRSYSNQRHHDILDRHKAKDFLNQFIGEIKQELFK